MKECFFLALLIQHLCRLVSICFACTTESIVRITSHGHLLIREGLMASGMETQTKHNGSGIISMMILATPTGRKRRTKVRFTLWVFDNVKWLWYDYFIWYERVDYLYCFWHFLSPLLTLPVNAFYTWETNIKCVKIFGGERERESTVCKVSRQSCIRSLAH